MFWCVRVYVYDGILLVYIVCCIGIVLLAVNFYASCVTVIEWHHFAFGTKYKILKQINRMLMETILLILQIKKDILM